MTPIVSEHLIEQYMQLEMEKAKIGERLQFELEHERMRVEVALERMRVKIEHLKLEIGGGSTSQCWPLI